MNHSSTLSTGMATNISDAISAGVNYNLAEISVMNSTTNCDVKQEGDNAREDGEQDTWPARRSDVRFKSCQRMIERAKRRQRMTELEQIEM